MTRINLIEPSELHYKHLVAETHEITRIFGLARKNQRDILGGRKVLPKEYTLGTGHCLFFLNKLKFIADRYEALTSEMLRRGYKPNPIPREELLGDIESGFARSSETFDKMLSHQDKRKKEKHKKPLDSKLIKDYIPTPEAIKINKQRIQERGCRSN